MKNLLKIVAVVMVSIILWVIAYGIYDTINYKDHVYWVSIIEKELSNRYVIGSNWKEKKICDKFLKYGCLEGNILNYIINEGYIYLYYKPYLGYSTSNQKIIYNVFWPYDSRVVEDINKIPDLIKMDIMYGVREFYHSSKRNDMNPYDRNIFEDLIKN